VRTVEKGRIELVSSLMTPPGIDRTQATSITSALLVRACPRIHVEERTWEVTGELIQLIRRHPVVTLFVLAYGLSWAVQIPRALGVLQGSGWRAVVWAPAVAAILAAALTGGRAALRDLGERLVRWRVRWQWYVLVILGPAAFSLAIAGVYALLGGSWSAAVPKALSEEPLVLLPVFFLILALTDGLGEEPAWRGFALPRLLTRHNALVASLIVGVLWALWHLPLLWTEGATRFQEPVWPILVDNTAKSVLFTWVFLNTRGSLLLAILLHASTNLFRVSPGPTSPGDFTLPLLAAGGKWLLVVIMLVAAGPSLVRGLRPEALYNPTSNGRVGDIV
jgi:CAAX protease family protein